MEPVGQIVITNNIHSDMFKNVAMPLCDYTSGAVLEVKEGSKVTTVVLEDGLTDFRCKGCFFEPAHYKPDPTYIKCSVCTHDRWFPCVYVARLNGLSLHPGIRFRSLGSVMEEL